MKRCRDCGKVVFACCGNEPGDYCYRCEEKSGVHKDFKAGNGEGVD
ncbi:MAG: hypothetical protein AB1324_00620 [Candidatus Micrarchaeota archaeon]